MLYTQNPTEDRNNIINHINAFVGANGCNEIQVDSQEVSAVCLRMRRDFPHVDGIEKASAFKKVANFVAHFMELRPIKSALDIPIDGIGVDYDINAVIAFDIAIASLEGSTIKFDDDSEKVVSNKIYVSDHSYADIIYALSDGDVKHKSHFHMLAVLFEQIVYKTNRHCEYKVTKDVGYYDYLPGGDDLYGA